VCEIANCKPSLSSIDNRLKCIKLVMLKMYFNSSDISDAFDNIWFRHEDESD